MLTTALDTLHLPPSVEAALGEDFSGVLSNAFRQRQGADYDAFSVFDTRDAADLITDIESFVQTVEVVVSPPVASSST